MSEKIAILMLTHNAPDYVRISIESVKARTTGVDYELIVVDNASNEPTLTLLDSLNSAGLIDVWHPLDFNSLFAQGNNIAAGLARDGTTHFLLLNSDIEIKRSDWLQHLMSVHRRGITAYGAVLTPPARADGYCLLIDADLYRATPLDETHQWWWSVTKQQAAILAQGHSVQAYSRHEEFLHHFGGKSGNPSNTALGMNVSAEEVQAWYGARQVTILDDDLGSRLKRLAQRVGWPDSLRKARI